MEQEPLGTKCHMYISIDKDMYGTGTASSQLTSAYYR